MDSNKWAPGDWAMLPVEVVAYMSTPVSEPMLTVKCHHGAGSPVDLLRPVDPPGHGRHLDGDALLARVESAERFMRKIAAVTKSELSRKDAKRTAMALAYVALEIREALNAQGGDDER